MINPREIYDLLLDNGNNNPKIKEIIIGLTWTLCTAEGTGLCMSPGTVTRTLPWSGTLVNKSISELAPWLLSWDNYQATIAMAAINSVINSSSSLPDNGTFLSPSGSANLAVFEHFLPEIRNKNVCIIGRYPGLNKYSSQMQMKVIELQPKAEDFPASASEYLLPEAEWVFLTATSIVNKTFPRLVELARNSKLVLMGPTVPWLSDFKHMGIDYLAGIKVTNLSSLRQTVAEGGGIRIFETGIQYCVVEL
ncbi:MAG: Rossmann-like domain-containing protein [Rivularia sp. (in: cyanobacteria)]